VKETNARWQSEPKDSVHEALAAVFRVVHNECAWRVDADEYHAGLYSASDRPGVRGSSRKGYEYGPATLPYNVCRSATDTLTSKIAKHRPLPQCLTQRGSWKNQKRARKMTQFLEGEFYRQRIYENHSARIVRDALVFGRGVLKVWVEGSKLRCERSHPWELYVDEWDARHGTPQNLYHCRSMDRGVALERFARTESGGMRKSVKVALEEAGRFTLDTGHDDDRDGMTVDRVDILEAWHLPSAEGAKDGRHVIICEGATLVDETWEFDYFPFAILNFSDPLVGFWGHGLVEQIEGFQYEINLASEKSSEQYRMSGVGILVPDNAKIHSEQVRNGITQIHHKAGGKPEVFQMDLVNEHTRQRPRELTQDALNESGLSQMSVQSQKPAGITAGVALQTLDDFETERFMVPGRAYEAWNLQVARLLIDGAKQIANDHGDHAVSVPMKGGLLDLKWSDVYVEGVEIRIFNTSLLPQQLGARLEKLKDMWNTGLLDRATFLRHLDAPDMQAELDLETADRLVVDEMLERMMEAEEEDGEEAYMPPSAYQQIWEEPTEAGMAVRPGWAPKRAQQKYNRGLLDGAPEFNLEMLRRFIKDCDELIANRKAEDVKPAPAPMGAAVPGGPMPGLAPPPGAAPPPPDLPGLGIPQAA
jgi:hypothetical protein